MIPEFLSLANDSKTLRRHCTNSRWQTLGNAFSIPQLSVLHLKLSLIDKGLCGHHCSSFNSAENDLLKGASLTFSAGGQLVFTCVKTF